MKKYAKKSQNKASFIDKPSRVSLQSPMSEILQTYRNNAPGQTMNQISVVQCLMSQDFFVQRTKPLVGRRGVHNGVFYLQIEDCLARYHQAVRNYLDYPDRLGILQELEQSIQDWRQERPDNITSRARIRNQLAQEVQMEINSIHEDIQLRQQDTEAIQQHMLDIQGDPRYDELSLILQDIMNLIQVIPFVYCSDPGRASSVIIEGRPGVAVCRNLEQEQRRGQIIHEMTHKFIERLNYRGLIGNADYNFEQLMQINQEVVSTFPQMDDNGRIVNQIGADRGNRAWFIRFGLAFHDIMGALLPDHAELRQWFQDRVTYGLNIMGGTANVNEVATVVNQMFFRIYRNRNLFNNDEWDRPEFQALRGLAHEFRIRPLNNHQNNDLFMFTIPQYLLDLFPG